MKTVILDLQSELYANALRRVLVQALEEVQVVISPRPEGTAQQCRLLQPQVLLMEVTPYTPWTLAERLALREQVAREAPDCRVALLVDDGADKALADEVIQARREGLVDGFLFPSAGESYLAATIDSL